MVIVGWWERWVEVKECAEINSDGKINFNLKILTIETFKFMFLFKIEFRTLV